MSLTSFQFQLVKESKVRSKNKVSNILFFLLTKHTWSCPKVTLWSTAVALQPQKAVWVFLNNNNNNIIVKSWHQIHHCLNLLTASDVSMTIMARYVYPSLMLVYFQVPGGRLIFKISSTMCTRLCLKSKNKKSPVWDAFASVTPRYDMPMWVFPKARRGAHLCEPDHRCQAWDFYIQNTLQRQNVSVGNENDRSKKHNRTRLVHQRARCGDWCRKTTNTPF